MDRVIEKNISYTNYFRKVNIINNNSRGYYKNIYIKNIQKHNTENICNKFNNYICDFTKLVLRSQENICLLKCSLLDNRFNVFTSEEVLEIKINTTNKCKLDCKSCSLERNIKKINEKEIVKNIDKIFKDVILDKYPKSFREYVITFYGGDPLLEFPSIINIVDEINCNHYINIQFNIISNGLLLTDEIVDKIIDRNLQVYVTFDYNSEMDYKQYEVIKENLLRYKTRYIYSKNIRTMINYNFYTDLEKMDKFYEKNRLPIAILKEDYGGKMNYWEKIPQEIIDKHLKQYKRLKDKYVDYNNEGKICSSFLKSLFNNFN